MDEPLTSLNTNRTHRFATCWKIEREDGAIFRFTNHDTALELDGNTYTPAGGFNASARQGRAHLEPSNLDFVGMISAGAITEDDLRGGLYRNAKITEYLVDWRYPWLGKFITNTYWVEELQFTGEHWEARVKGLGRYLEPKVGRVYSRTCQHTLGDASCDVDLGPLTANGTVGTVITARRIFQSDLGQANGYFDYGLLTWTSGDNDGLTTEVYSFLNANGLIRLTLEAPFDIDAADTFDVIHGCDKRASTCKDTFSNLVNFGGFPFIPGTNKMFLSPMSR